MTSAIRDLSDADLEQMRHMLRRRRPQLEVARWVSERLGRPMAASDKVAVKLISRCATGREFRTWLERWENRDQELKKQIALQQQRFELLSELVKGRDGKGLYEASNHLKGRLLLIASEMSDEELASGDARWIKGLLQEIRDAEKLERGAQVERLKTEIERLMASPAGGKAADPKAVVEAVDKIMGLA